MKLPYRCTTATGDTYDIEFPLHEATESPMRASQILSAVLEAIDRDIAVCGETANGDVLQALAMAMAIRGGMVHAPQAVTDRLSQDLLSSAQAAMAEAGRSAPPSGHA